jgi:uncharacterized RDD family membrane protein YckC
MAEVVTGEAVVLDLAVARFPSRIIAQLLDILVQLPVIAFIEIVVVGKAAQHLNGASSAALLIIGFVLVIIAYPVTFETLSRGKTLGKLAMGLRVVSDDGGPERFRQALIRALAAAFIEIWGFPINVIGMPTGLVTSMASAKGKRLGDMFAGTFVIQERVPRRPDLAPAFTFVAPPLVEWARHVELSRLSDQTAATASSYLRRYYQLRPAARAQLGLSIAGQVAAHVSPPPPPGTPPEAYLAAVLAIRREREHARFARAAAAQASPAPYAQAGPDAQAGPGTTAQGAAWQPVTAQPVTAQPVTAQPVTAQPAQFPTGQPAAGPPAHFPTGQPGSAEPALPRTEPADWTEPQQPAAAPPEDFGFAKPF